MKYYTYLYMQECMHPYMCVHVCVCDHLLLCLGDKEHLTGEEYEPIHSP